MVIYRRNASGLLTRLAATVTTAADGTYTAAFLGDGLNSTYFVSTTGALLAPGYEATRVQVDLNHPAEYLIIYPPGFHLRFTAIGGSPPGTVHSECGGCD